MFPFSSQCHNQWLYQFSHSDTHLEARFSMFSGLFLTPSLNFFFKPIRRHYCTIHTYMPIFCISGIPFDMLICFPSLLFVKLNFVHTFPFCIFDHCKHDGSSIQLHIHQLIRTRWFQIYKQNHPIPWGGFVMNQPPQSMSKVKYVDAFTQKCFSVI